MKFKIGTTVYDAAELSSLTLADILSLEKQLKDLGQPLTWGDIVAMTAEISAIKDADERARHPQAMWVLGFTIWVARRGAGEDVKFAESIDFPLESLTFLQEPGDEVTENPTKARPGSGPGAGPRRAAQRPKTSKRLSTAG